MSITLSKINGSRDVTRFSSPKSLTRKEATAALLNFQVEMRGRIGTVRLLPTSERNREIRFKNIGCFAAWFASQQSLRRSADAFGDLLVTAGYKHADKIRTEQPMKTLEAIKHINRLRGPEVTSSDSESVALKNAGFSFPSPDPSSGKKGKYGDKPMAGGFGQMTPILKGHETFLMKEGKSNKTDGGRQSEREPIGSFSIDTKRPPKATQLQGETQTLQTQKETLVAPLSGDGVYLIKEGEAIGIYFRDDTAPENPNAVPMSKYLLRCDSYLLKYVSPKAISPTTNPNVARPKVYHVVPNTTLGKTWIKTQLETHRGRFDISGIMMPKATGVDLHKAIQLNRHSDLKKHLIYPGHLQPICQYFLSALRVMSEHGVVHGDIKPANIIFNPDGEIKLIDFGLGYKDSKTDSTSRYAHLGGTQGYKAPSGYSKQEQMSYERDMIAAGVTIMETAFAASASRLLHDPMERAINKVKGLLGIGEQGRQKSSFITALSKLQDTVEKSLHNTQHHSDERVHKAFDFGLTMINEAVKARQIRLNETPNIGTFRYVSGQETPWGGKHPLDTLASHSFIAGQNSGQVGQGIDLELPSHNSRAEDRDVGAHDAPAKDNLFGAGFGGDVDFGGEDIELEVPEEIGAGDHRELPVPDYQRFGHGASRKG